MNILDAIINRKSIRKFLSKDVDRDIINKIIEAGILAPSPKNRQPWKFIVVTNENKSEMIETIKNGFEKAGNGLLKDFVNFNPSAWNTVKTMETAPVTIFVINTENNFSLNQTPEEKLFEMANIQSIGASIENMILAAMEYGIGSLWICDIFFAYRDICKWLNTDRQIVAAVSLGYPDENPSARPRKEMNISVEWK
ncbi:MAG: nitroreductase family protein [Treponema sp.]|jgi:nitroreductase|nr:nitroreductase family protein [Treponema sp.]